MSTRIAFEISHRDRWVRNQSVPLEGVVTLGAAASCDVVLPGDGVGAQHVFVFPAGQQIRLIARGGHDFIVGGMRVRETLEIDRGEFEIGPWRIRLVVEASPEPVDALAGDEVFSSARPTGEVQAPRPRPPLPTPPAAPLAAALPADAAPPPRPPARPAPIGRALARHPSIDDSGSLSDASLSDASLSTRAALATPADDDFFEGTDTGVEPLAGPALDGPPPADPPDDATGADHPDGPRSTLREDELAGWRLPPLDLDGDETSDATRADDRDALLGDALLGDAASALADDPDTTRADDALPFGEAIHGSEAIHATDGTDGIRREVINAIEAIHGIDAPTRDDTRAAADAPTADARDAAPSPSAPRAIATAVAIAPAARATTGAIRPAAGGWSRPAPPPAPPPPPPPPPIAPRRSRRLVRPRHPRAPRRLVHPRPRRAPRPRRRAVIHPLAPRRLVRPRRRPRAVIHPLAPRRLVHPRRPRPHRRPHPRPHARPRAPRRLVHHRPRPRRPPPAPPIEETIAAPDAPSAPLPPRAPPARLRRSHRRPRRPPPLAMLASAAVQIGLLAAALATYTPDDTPGSPPPPQWRTIAAQFDPSTRPTPPETDATADPTDDTPAPPPPPRPRPRPAPAPTPAQAPAPAEAPTPAKRAQRKIGESVRRTASVLDKSTLLDAPIPRAGAGAKAPGAPPSPLGRGLGALPLPPGGAGATKAPGLALGDLGRHAAGAPGKVERRAELGQGGDERFQGGSATEREAVKSAIRRKSHRFQLCLDRTAVHYPGLAGRLEMSFDITPGGAPARVRGRLKPTDNTMLVECFAREIGNIRFERDTPGTIGVNYTFIVRGS
ncbi:MAG: AgmX/PglI C-terminal domain-containing protein [bacterium]